MLLFMLCFSSCFFLFYLGFHLHYLTSLYLLRFGIRYYSAFGSYFAIPFCYCLILSPSFPKFFSYSIWLALCFLSSQSLLVALILCSPQHHLVFYFGSLSP